MTAARERERADARSSPQENHTAALAQYVADVPSLPLPDEIAEASRRGILDWLGAAIAGSRESAAQIITGLQLELGGNPQAALIARAERTSVVQAALANGTTGHALDYDDTHLGSGVHVSAAILPAILAIGELRGSSGGEILRAYAAGFETIGFLGEVLYEVHLDAAWHGTATVGTLGATVAAASLLHLNKEQAIAALGMAVTHASGLRQNFGSMTKPLHAGKAASAGVLSALLAERGFTANDVGIEGRQGLYAGLRGGMPEPLREAPPPTGFTYAVTNDFKLHACCHATHASVDTALKVYQDRPLTPDEIERVDLYCCPIVEEIAAKPRPRTGLEGKFSVGYCVLTTLLDGHAGRSQFTDEKVQHGPTRPLLERFTMHPTPGLSIFQARLDVALKSGETLHTEVEAPLGSSGNPVSWDLLAGKFHDLADPILGAEQMATLEQTIRALPDGAGAADLARHAALREG